MSPGMQHRRDSYAETTGVFPPSNAPWPAYTYAAEHVSVQPSNNLTHPLSENGGHTYHRPQALDSLQSSNGASAWSLSGTSGSCTPTATYETLGTEYMSNVLPSYTANVSCPSPPHPFEGLQLRSTQGFQSVVASTTSPLSSKDWLSNSSPEHQGDWSAETKLRSSSPSNFGNIHLFKRDGIRKKNARFEIPAERNLRTIDHLINQTSDEQEIKELKQQKRLLRNRQAA